jgi:hypothetical protein
MDFEGAVNLIVKCSDRLQELVKKDRGLFSALVRNIGQEHILEPLVIDQTVYAFRKFWPPPRDV